MMKTISYGSVPVSELKSPDISVAVRNAQKKIAFGVLPFGLGFLFCLILLSVGYASGVKGFSISGIWGVLGHLGGFIAGLGTLFLCALAYYAVDDYKKGIKHQVKVDAISRILKRRLDRIYTNYFVLISMVLQRYKRPGAITSELLDETVKQLESSVSLKNDLSEVYSDIALLHPSNISSPDNYRKIQKMVMYNALFDHICDTILMQITLTSIYISSGEKIRTGMEFYELVLKVIKETDSQSKLEGKLVKLFESNDVSGMSSDLVDKHINPIISVLEEELHA